MSHDPQVTLRPLNAVEGDVIALRTGRGGAAAVVRVSRAAETVLRRMLRDDPTVPVELRLRALSSDDLPTGELLAELRRRDRLPMELAASFHDLSSSADRLATEGGDATARDAEVAVAVADGLERHVLTAPHDGPMQDPVLTQEETRIPQAPEDPEPVHAVPPMTRGKPSWPVIGASVGFLALILLAAVLLRGRGNDPLEEGEALLARGDTVRAAELFRQAALKDPKEPRAHEHLAHIYRRSGRTPEAARELREGLSAAPGDPGLNTELGYLLLDQRRAPQAVERFRAAVLADSTSARAWVGMVRALREAGRPAEAERVLARAPEEVRALIASAPAPAPMAAPPPVTDTMAYPMP